MIKVGLIGYGKWGKILKSKLDKFCDVKFVCRSKDNYLSEIISNDLDWVIIATPNYTHYQIVKNCLWFGKNVFCEKPLTLTYEESEKLYKLADKQKLKLYVDDVQNFIPINFKLQKNNFIERKKNDIFNGGYCRTRDLLYRLAYHDIYFLYKHIKDKSIKDIISIETENKLNFKILFEDIEIEFLYDTYFKGKEHNINGKSLLTNSDPVYDMLYKVLNDEVDFNYNKKISLFTNEIIDKINDKLFKKIAVVGGGIFGSTAAWILSMENYEVDLYEKNSDLITQASYINQYRLHRGYHYPRSKETAQSSINGEKTFLDLYGDAIMNDGIEHYYCIAKRDSLVSSSEYESFLNELNLKYEKKTLDIIQENVVDLIVNVEELLFDPNLITEIVWNNLKKSNVNVHLNTEKDLTDLDKYDYIINATYTNLNRLLPPNKHRDYQFELCEKPVVRLPEKYKNKSVVIMDGPFMCIDPLGGTDYHVMGNVVHAIHSTNTGKFPICDPKYEELLNTGIVKNPSITNIDKFIETAKHFFVDIDKAEHIGSMFTFRTVLPNTEHDDARPTLINREDSDDRIFTLFSGKIGTCVDAATGVLNRIKGDVDDRIK